MTRWRAGRARGNEVKDYDFNPYNLPPDLLTAIGLALANAAQTEAIVSQAIAGCLGIDAEYGGALTTHMQMPLRFSILRSVAEIRIDNLDDLDELDLLIEQIDVAFQKRNVIAHNTWCRDPETNETFIVKEIARTRYEMDLIPMSTDQVEGDALFIYEAGMKLQKFLGSVGLLPPLPPHSRPRAHKSKAARKKRRENGQTADSSGSKM
jgi:hypothetical protein